MILRGLLLFWLLHEAFAVQILKIETTGVVLSCVICQAQNFLLVVEVGLRSQMLSWNGFNGVFLAHGAVLRRGEKGQSGGDA